MSEIVELEIGDLAPDFECIITNGTIIKLTELTKNSKGLILYFYPRDNTPGCTVQACDFRDSFGRFKDTGWKVVGVSTDSAKSHEKFINKFDLPFDLIVDEDSALHKKYGVWRKKNMYGKEYMGCLRSTFVISNEQKILIPMYGVKTKGHVDLLLRELGVE